MEKDFDIEEQNSARDSAFSQGDDTATANDSSEVKIVDSFENDGTTDGKQGLPSFSLDNEKYQKRKKIKRTIAIAIPTSLLTIALILVIAYLLAPLFAPNNDEVIECTSHVDSDGDVICDICGEPVDIVPDEQSGFFDKNGGLILFSDGAPTFNIVTGNDLDTSNISELEALVSALNARSTTEITVVDSSDSNKSDVEILIGTVTTRGDEYSVDKHTLGLRGYIVKQVGTKIIVLGGNTDSLDTAIGYLKEDVFGIKRAVVPFTDFSMSAEMGIESIQDNYAVTDVTLDGTSIKGYALAYSNGDIAARNVALDFQESLYEKTGIWLDIMPFNDVDDDTPYIRISTIENDGEGGGFYFNIDSDKNATLECEYENKFVHLASDFFYNSIFADNIRGVVRLANHNPDLRNIYYEDYGAMGDGVTDDFFALKSAHEDANENKLIVHASEDAVYYIGSANEDESITIMTDTYWHGCRFIFDDTVILPDSQGRTTSIFTIKSDAPSTTLTGNDIPFSTLSEGATNVGFAPGYRAMLILTNTNVKHFIRYGTNQDNGASQTELIMIDKDGNIDPSTPVQWDYNEITAIEIISVEDQPITIDGGSDLDTKAVIQTLANNAPSEYTWYERNIHINRSNVTVKSIEHIITGEIPESESGTCAPYSGFTNVSKCENVVIDDFIFQQPEAYYHQTNTNTIMGTYEMSASYANNILWSNSIQSNFFEEDGSVKYRGLMSTNYCKNLTFDNMFVSSFDAHKGAYNATIKNSVCEHLNFIGEGIITLENVTIYADASKSAIRLREDYGSTWEGDVNIDGLTLKVSSSNVSMMTNLAIIKATHYEHDFGYTCYLPENITLKNVLTEEISHELVGEGNGTNNRIEHHVAYNSLALYVFSSSIGNNSLDLSSDENVNPIVPTATINHYTVYTDKYAELGITTPLDLIMPTSPTFKDTKIYIDDVEQ